MQKKINQISINILYLLTITLTLFVFSCESKSKTKKNKKQDIPKSIEKENFNTGQINFYFENSGSINGYLGGKNFKQTLHRIFGGINKDSLNSYFVNTKEYLVKDILNKIDKRDIKSGDRGNSDHEFIFTNAINHAKNNNLSIVVTDGIYSLKGGDIDIVEIDIEHAFKNSLTKNEIETVTLKMSSNFKGTYYTESKCDNVKLNQNRPYYILLFGNKNIIDNALKEIIIVKNFDGFENEARFFITKKMNTRYSILTVGEEKKGTFKRIDRVNIGDVLEIKGAEKYNRRDEKHLQFGIAVDFSNISLPDSYLTELKNYSINKELGYNITDIKTIKDLSKTTKTSKELVKIDDKYSKKFTHIITVRADKNLYGELEIKLENNLPIWIKTTGLKNDCNIKNDENGTFAFDKLMNGISKAYKKVNKKNEFLTINLKINI